MLIHLIPKYWLKLSKERPSTARKCMGIYLQTQDKDLTEAEQSFTSACCKLYYNHLKFRWWGKLLFWSIIHFSPSRVTREAQTHHCGHGIAATQLFISQRLISTLAPQWKKPACLKAGRMQEIWDLLNARTPNLTSGSDGRFILVFGIEFLKDLAHIWDTDKLPTQLTGNWDRKHHTSCWFSSEALSDCANTIYLNKERRGREICNIHKHLSESCSI